MWDISQFQSCWNIKKLAFWSQLNSKVFVSTVTHLFVIILWLWKYGCPVSEYTFLTIDFGLDQCLPLINGLWAEVTVWQLWAGSLKVIQDLLVPVVSVFHHEWIINNVSYRNYTLSLSSGMRRHLEQIHSLEWENLNLTCSIKKASANL